MGLINGVLLGTGWVWAGKIVYHRLPKPIQEFILRHPLLTEVVSTVVAFEGSGGSVTGLFAGATACIEVTGLQHIARNPEQFQWLNDLIESASDELKTKVATLNEWAAEINAAHKARKEAEGR